MMTHVQFVTYRLNLDIVLQISNETLLIRPQNHLS